MHHLRLVVLQLLSFMLCPVSCLRAPHFGLSDSLLTVQQIGIHQPRENR